jgi:Kef-type K+ transport system membrane component KefB
MGLIHNALSAPFPLLLLQLSVILIAAVFCGWIARRLGQPAVIGEMAAGILIGPSVLGRFLPGLEASLFPADGLGGLNLLSQVGVILFMFSVGLSIDLGGLRAQARMAFIASHAGILVPFVSGLAIGRLILEAYAPRGVGTLAFSLFMGIAMSITAFPVLARILSERGLTLTRLGTMAMACAAVDDVTAWTLLALILAIARSESLWSTVMVAAQALAFSALLLLLIRPGIGKWIGRIYRSDPESSGPARVLAPWILVFVFLCAFTTEAIGIHSLFGAFLAGVVMPPIRPLKDWLKDRVDSTAALALVPVFFAFTGLRVHLDSLSRGTDWAVFALLLAVAVAGKLGGVSLAARISGYPWRDALALGALMNTRGLMELIVLNVGLDMGILSPRIFAMMVLVALATTMMTGPLLSALRISGSTAGGPRGS